MDYAYCYDTDIGEIVTVENGQGITKLYFARTLKNFKKDDCVIQETPLLGELGKQLKEYLAGQRRIFDLPLSFDGTEFQMKVWSTLFTIPYGETRSYREVAAIFNHPRAARAVGFANNLNPLPILIPCHRVVGTSGELTGYAAGIEIKKHLLDLEKRVCKSDV
ncbi:MAG: methylated-DNA--[protein]-cysteine S-methyltransferase [Oscillospiraceae bacterium]|jgi:methylated-DNA-[protein]-cysteine S-methyltransferase|nr:methylated-DNA--[protein]-cysteine S-methyltransferase [Oscillospiraceae bacterium]